MRTCTLPVRSLGSGEWQAAVSAVTGELMLFTLSFRCPTRDVTNNHLGKQLCCLGDTHVMIRMNFLTEWHVHDNWIRSR